ncbi:methionine adenosyltransferase [Canibacter zhoujuaniae]|uniref:methionine adenosyltransferase n=1 Tax=Canibacter zhoujuaniae TaxID=2708343 RepID=UPI00141ED326|nr:methionine adenosyltransferase [Canibacter zhoujuaniae]
MQLFTSESVTAGHPDKLCDQVSDAILDAYLGADPTSRVAVETLAGNGRIVIAGEVSSNAGIDLEAIARKTIREIGYTDPAYGLDAANCEVQIFVAPQSPEIGEGVSVSAEQRSATAEDPFDLQGAGDQGIMFGYATNETPTLMPPALTIAHALAARLQEVRQTGVLEWLRPDGKTQVTLGLENGVPKLVDTVVLSTQHAEHVSQDEIREAAAHHVVAPILHETGLDLEQLKLHVNPSGSFIVGGPQADAGLTGRKIIIDTYGGAARHGGGAFSGKDPSKVDRSGAYAMRWLAKHVVAAGLAERAELQVAYAIGKARPVGLYVDTFGTGVISDEEIAKALQRTFDLRPAALIDELKLKRPIYAKTAAYGHFGRELPEFTWEHTPKIAALKQAAA